MRREEHPVFPRAVLPRSSKRRAQRLTQRARSIEPLPSKVSHPVRVSTWLAFSRDRAPLIKERNTQEQHAEDEKRHDAVEAAENGKIVEKHFRHDNGEKRQRLPAQHGGVAGHASKDQSGCINRPKHREAQLLSEPTV